VVFWSGISHRFLAGRSRYGAYPCDIFGRQAQSQTTGGRVYLLLLSIEHSNPSSPLRKSAVRDGRARGYPMVVYKPILILPTLLCHFLSKKEREVKRACSIEFVPFTVCPLPMAPPISTHKSPQQLFAPTGKKTACPWQRHALSRESWVALCLKQYQYWL
jgi:hypothetical protein